MPEQNPEIPESFDKTSDDDLSDSDGTEMTEQERINEMVELANRFIELAREFAEENQLREKNEHLAQKNRDLEIGLQKTEEQIESLRSQLATEQKNLETLKQKNEELERKIEKRDKQIKNLNDQLKIEKGKMYEAARQLNELSQSIRQDYESSENNQQNDQTIIPKFKAVFVSSKLEKEQNKRHLETLQNQFPEVEWKLLEVPTRNRSISVSDFVVILSGPIKNHKDTDWIKQFAKNQATKIINRKSMQKVIEGITILLSQLSTT